MADISFQVRLVEAVEKQPCLYDFQLKEYSNREKVQSAWEAVAREVETSVKKCRDTWRNLRIVFARNLKQPPPGDKAKKKPWPLLQTMMFLKSYVTAKGNDLLGNLPSPPSQSLLEADDSSAISETQGEEGPDQEGEATRRRNEAVNPRSEEIGPMGPSPKKKKIQSTAADEIVLDYRSKTMASNDNPRKHFLLSLLPDVEEMTTPQFRNFRMEVVSLIDRVLAPAWPTSDNS